MLNIFASLARFERTLTIERTHAGLKSARARERLGGRKAIEVHSPQVKMAKKMFKDRTIDVSDISSTLKISRATYYRYLSP